MKQQTTRKQEDSLEQKQDHQLITKVIFKKQLETLVRYDSSFHPQWIGDTHICYGSAYQFTNYNVDEESISLLIRPQMQGKVITACFAKQFNQSGIEVVYIIRQNNTFFLCVAPSLTFSKKPITDKNRQKDIENVHQIFKIQSQNIVLMIITKQKLKCLLIMCLYTNLSQIFTQNQSIEQIIPLKNPQLIILRTKSLILLVKIHFERMTIKILKSYQLLENSKIALLTDFSIDYIVIIMNKKITLLSILDNNFIKIYQLQLQIQQIGGLCYNYKTLLIWQKNKSLIYNLLLDQDLLIIKNKFQLELGNSLIDNMLISQKNRNILLITKHNELIDQFYIFKFDLYTQLNLTDPQIYMKQLGFIYKERKVQEIIVSKVNDTLYALTGMEVHKLTDRIIDGILSFDIHPLNFYLAVSFGFAAKIYSLEAGNNISLLSSYSMNNIRKIQYTPSGSSLILFTSRLIKIIDAYSFKIKYQLIQKNSSFIDISFGSTGYYMYILTESGCIYTYSTFDFQKIDTFRNHTYQKFINIKIHQKSQTHFLLTQKGNLIVRNKFADVKVYQYQQKISCFQLDNINQILFLGTFTGNIKAYILPMLQDKNICLYSQLKICFSQITCMNINPLNQSLYIGNSQGNITHLKYYIGTNNFQYINDQLQISPCLNNLQKYILCNNPQQQKVQKTLLQSKLEQVIIKINQQLKQSKNIFKIKYQNKKQQYSCKVDTKKLFYQNKQKINLLEQQNLHIQQQFIKQKKNNISKYQQSIKSIINQQQYLINKKFMLLSLHQLAKSGLKANIQKQQQQLKKKILRLTSEKQSIVKQIYYQAKIPLDEIYHVPQFDTSVINSYRQELDLLLKQQKKKCYQLRKQYIYLQTAQSNIVAKKVKQETLQYRIKREIDDLSSTKANHKKIQQILKQNLTQTENIMQRIQNQVSPSQKLQQQQQTKFKTDICSYQLHKKQQVQIQIGQLYRHLLKIQQQLQSKRRQLIQQSKIKKQQNQLYNQLLIQISKLKKLLEKKKQIKLNQQYSIKITNNNSNNNSNYYNNNNNKNFNKSMRYAIKKIFSAINLLIQLIVIIQ